MSFLRTTLILLALAGMLTVNATAEMPDLQFHSLVAKDSLNPPEEASDDARHCLTGLIWPPSEFEVSWNAPLAGKGDALALFPSPIPSGDLQNDRVPMECYFARDKNGAPITAPAVVVVHESGSKMAVGRVFARGFQTCGVHAFLIHLPYYGNRRSADDHPDRRKVIDAIPQAVADVRRARDAVAALPYVQNGRVSLQGTSLGGFVSATSACLDSGAKGCGYENVFILLAGGNLMQVIQSGKKDAAKFRQQLEQSGLSLNEISELVNRVEPMRIAHRLDPKHTWLYSADYDQVVPIQNAIALAHTADLDPSHHVRMLGNHYSGIVYIPFVIPKMAKAIREN
ncbi:dienelactone hydrolase family protein [Novipirellula sp. SH528]|uniref:dienelactone hydrolase family protein n=1 Tax=Novipirellula sp. SH528 TaxID=3454466 RepID=UPI003F9FE87C